MAEIWGSPSVAGWQRGIPALQHGTRAAVRGWLEGAAEKFPARRTGLRAPPASSPVAQEHILTNIFCGQALILAGF